MATRFTPATDAVSQVFIDLAAVELHRAERYRVFVSMLVLDLSSVQRLIGSENPGFLGELVNQARSRLRACDYVSLIDGACLALLLPETSRQEAEIPAKRIAEMVRQQVLDLTGIASQEIIPVEIASYPDTAGAKTLEAFLDELAFRNRN
jgi:GGDEF domain-containing protein